MDHLQLLGAAPSGAARGDGPHVASKFVEIEHTKDKQGGNQNWMEFVKMLQQLHKVAPVMATKEVSVEGCVLENCDRCFEEAKTKFAALIPYSIDSYDLAYLKQLVEEKIREAKEDHLIILENRCCSKADCPQILFMTTYVETLKQSKN